METHLQPENVVNHVAKDKYRNLNSGVRRVAGRNECGTITKRRMSLAASGDGHDVCTGVTGIVVWSEE